MTKGMRYAIVLPWSLLLACEAPQPTRSAEQISRDADSLWLSARLTDTLSLTEQVAADLVLHQRGWDWRHAYHKRIAALHLDSAAYYLRPPQTRLGWALGSANAHLGHVYAPLTPRQQAQFKKLRATARKAGDRLRAAEGPRPAQGDAGPLPKHRLVSNTPLGPGRGRRLEIHVGNAGLTKIQCAVLIMHYQAQAAPGQVSVHKPDRDGDVFPWCVQNFDGDGIIFFDLIFR